MKRLRLFAACVLLAGGLQTGCGSDSRSPIPLDSFTLSGQVLNTVAGAAGRGALAVGDPVSSTFPVAGATIRFIPAEGTLPGKTVTTSQTGAYTLSFINKPVKGVLEATWGNRKLEAWVDPGASSAFMLNLTRNITVESTVTNQIRKTVGLGSLSAQRMEELVRLGEAGQLAQAVVDSLAADQPLSASLAIIQQGQEEVVGLSNEVGEACEAGQTWCVVVSEIKNHNGVAKARVDLIKSESATGGTVGAGQFTVQWPAGIGLTTLVPSPGMAEKLLVKSNGQSPSEVVFFVKDAAGFGQTQQLFQLTLSGAPPQSGGEHHASITTQKLRGLLNEKRSASRVVVP